MYKKFRRNREKIEEAFLADKTVYIWRLNAALSTVFWMYVIYSINYFGLSAYYWYLFAGLTIAFSRVYFNENDISAIEHNKYGKG